MTTQTDAPDGKATYHTLVQIAVENGEFDVVLCPSDHMLAFAEYIEGIRSERDAALARVAELEVLANTALDELHQLKNTFNFSRMIMDADRRVAAGEIIDDVQAFIMKSRVALSPKEGG